MGKMFLKFSLSFVVSCLLYLGAEAQLHAECITPNNETATCESIYKCKVYLDVINTATDSQKKFIAESLCGRINSVPVVCCGSDNDYKAPFRPKRESHFRLNSANSSSSCGTSINDDERVIGNKALNGQFPWSARLQYNKTDTFSCEGTLINSRYVLTAGICLAEKTLKRVGNLRKIRLGEHNCYEFNDHCKDERLDVGIEEIILNPNFGLNRNVNHDDIGLVRLDRAVTFSDAIRPICLQNPGDAPATAGDSVTETGWYQNSDEKLRADLPIVSFEDCNNLYKKHRVVLTDSYLCAGGNDENTCAGMSGGSLMKRNAGKWYLEGIISFGPKECAANGLPNVYTNVSRYISWIHSSVKV